MALLRGAFMGAFVWFATGRQHALRLRAQAADVIEGREQGDRDACRGKTPAAAPACLRQRRACRCNGLTPLLLALSSMSATNGTWLLWHSATTPVRNTRRLARLFLSPSCAHQCSAIKALVAAASRLFL
jgi:hypothetical protein